MINLWTELHRPDTIDGYVFADQNQRSQIESWIAEKSIPHLLFSGAPGTGKTTLAKILINQLETHPYDLLELNASRDNSVDNMRTKITNFVSMIPFGSLKIVLLDEADYLSPAAQAILRGLTEQYAASARFILTCNYPHKIIPALHSRCQGFHIERLDQVEFTARVAEILIKQNVEFDLDALDTYVRSTFPDLRKCINSVQQNSKNGKLIINTATTSSDDYKISAVGLFKQGKIKEARTLICKQVKAEEIDELISWAYHNLDLWSSTDEGQDQAILVIRKAAVNASLVADHELNIAAMFLELSQIEG